MFTFKCGKCDLPWLNHQRKDSTYLQSAIGMYLAVDLKVSWGNYLAIHTCLIFPE